MKVLVLLTETGDFARMNEVRELSLSERYPTRMTYGTVLTVPGVKAEIDAIAYGGK